MACSLKAAMVQSPLAPQTFRAKLASSLAPEGRRPRASITTFHHPPSDAAHGNPVDVVTPRSIGSISDLLVDKNGRVMAAIIGVGGFLGIGAKDVAISFDSLQVTQDKDGNPQARLGLTKKELEGAPDARVS